MAVLAFLVMVIYWPGITGTAIPTGWALLSIALPLATWRRGSSALNLLHWLGLGFLAWVVASLAWAPSLHFGIFALWQLGIIAGAFLLGSQLKDPKPILIGAALGLGVNSIVCIEQWFGQSPVLMNFHERPSGLMYNSVALGTTAAIVLVWLFARRMYWLIPCVLPSFLLPLSKGAFAAVAAVWAFRVVGWWGLLLVAAFFGLVVFDYNQSNSIRVALWIEGLKHLTALGAGAGAIESVYLDIAGQLISPEYLHSEPLDLSYHYGLLALLPLAIAALALLRRSSDEWYPFACFAIMALYSFPLHIPASAFLGAVLAGHLCRNWHLAWSDLCHSGYAWYYRHFHRRSRPNPPSSGAIPI